MLSPFAFALHRGSAKVAFLCPISWVQRLKVKPTSADLPAVVRCVVIIQEVQEGVSEAFKSDQAASPAQEAAPSQGPAGHAPTGARQQAAAPRALWSEAAELAEARERSQWHELMSRRNIEQNEKLQVRLILLTSLCWRSSQSNLQAVPTVHQLVLDQE